MSLDALIHTCAPQIDAATMHAVVAVESAGDPLAIGVVGAVLERQPRHLAEAVATARALQQARYSFSVGLGQINVSNFERLGLDVASAFEPCANLRAAAAILSECYARAVPKFEAGQGALRAALSCYYSGGFQRGFQPEPSDGRSYVDRVVDAARTRAPEPFAVKR